MISKHTPGPWRLERCSVLIPIAPYEWAEAYGGSEANARLIALAPEMYDYIAAAASNGCLEAKKLLAKAGGNEQQTYYIVKQ